MTAAERALMLTVVRVVRELAGMVVGLSNQQPKWLKRCTQLDEVINVLEKSQ